MNAVMREPYEVLVVANETIESSITSLRSSFAHVEDDVSELKADSRTLRDKIDRNHETLSKDQTALRDKVDATRSELIGRVDQVRTDLTSKIDQVDSKLGAKIDQVDSKLSTKIEQLDLRLSEKIDQIIAALGKTNVDIAGLKGTVKTMAWLVCGVVSLAGFIEIVLRLGDKFHWF